MLPLLVQKELRVEGFLVGRWVDRWMEGLTAMADWVKQGKVKVDILLQSQCPEPHNSRRGRRWWMVLRTCRTPSSVCSLARALARWWSEPELHETKR